MTDKNNYKYELKIQALTEQVNVLNNQIMDLRVEWTVTQEELKAASTRIAELENREAASVQAQETPQDSEEN